MPIYDSEKSLEELKRMAETHICGQCGTGLTVAWGGSFGYEGYVLRCANDAGHNQIERPAYISPIDLPGFNLNPMTKRRKKEMAQQFGDELSTKLVKYHGVVSLSKEQAMEILTTIWPDAPEVEVKKAALLCMSYSLNPLMKHVFLIPFNKDKPNESWATVMGIKAKRLISSRRGAYSYIDNTPRVMIEDEQKTIFGKIYDDRLWVITKGRDPATGAEAVGYGFWLYKDTVYGTDKGNSDFNMASVRSESQMIDRLRPGEMPAGIEVMPEDIAEVASKGGIIEGEVRGLEGEVSEEKLDQPSHGIDMEWLKEACKKLNWKESTLKSYLKNVYKVSEEGSLGDVIGRLSPEQKQGFCKEITDRLGMQ